MTNGEKKLIVSDFTEYESSVKEKLEKMKNENPEYFKIVIDAYANGEDLSSEEERRAFIKDAYYYGDLYSKSEDLMATLMKDTGIELSEDLEEGFDYDDFRNELISLFIDTELNSPELKKEYEKYKNQWENDYDDEEDCLTYEEWLNNDYE